MSKRFVFLLLLLPYLCLSIANANWLEDLYDGDVFSAEKAIKSGADVNEYSEEFGAYPIHIALYSESLDTLEMVAHYGADLEAENEDGQTVMMIALEFGDLNIVKLLQNLGARLDVDSGSGMSPLHYAVLSGNAELVSWLIQQGYDVNKISTSNWSVLDSLTAMEDEFPDPLLAETLLTAGLDSKLRSNEGYSLLHWAVLYGQYNLVEQLFEQGYDPLEVSHEDETAYEFALYSDSDETRLFMYQDIQARLDNAESNLTGDQIDILKKERLRLAISINEEEAFRRYFTKKDLKYRSADNSSLLHYAVVNHRVEITQFLLEQGADLQATNHYDDTPYAASKYDEDNPVLPVIVKAISENGPQELRVQLAEEYLYDGEVEQFLALRPHLTPDEMSLLNFEIIGSDTEEGLGVWLEYAAKEDDVMLSKLYPLVPAIYQDDEFLSYLSVIQTNNKSIPNDVQISMLIRLLEVNTELDIEQKATYNAALASVTENTQQLIENGHADEIVSVYIRYQDYKPALQLLDRFTSVSLQQHIESVFDNFPEETGALVEDLVLKLMALGADPSLSNNQGNPLFLDSVGVISQPLFDQIIKGKDLNEIGSGTGVMLLTALINSAPKRAEVLLEQGRFRYQKEWNGLLRLAYNQDNLALCYALWSQGAYTQSMDSEGRFLITNIYQSWYQEPYKQAIPFTDWLTTSGESIDVLVSQKDMSENRFLDYLIAENDKAVIWWLFEHGLMINDTTLSSFARSKNIELIASVIEKLDDEKQASLFHLAIQYRNEPLTAYLLNAGFDPLKKNQKKQTGFEIAMYSADQSILDLMMDYYPEPLINYSPSESYFDSDLVRYWSWLSNTGQTRTLQSHLEKHLLNGQPHPFARHIWLTVATRKNTLDKEDVTISNSLKAAMGKGFEAERLANLGERDEAIEQYLLVEPTEQDLWLVHEIADLYINADEQEKSWDVLETGIKLSPNFWQFSWRYFSSGWLNNEIFRVRAQKLVNSPELKGTLFSQYGQAVLSARSINPIDLQELKDKWYQKTHDARLLTSMGYLYSTGGYLVEAKAAFEQAVMSYPFYSNWGKYVEIIAKTGDYALVESQNVLKANWYDEEQESRFVRQQRYNGQAFLNAGDKGKAHQVYNALVDKNSLFLGYYLAELERSDDRHLQAIKALEPLIGNDDFDASNWKNIVKSYSEIGETARAIELFEQALITIPYPTISLYLEGLVLYKSAQMTVEYDRLLNQSLEIYPRSIEIHKETILAFLNKKQYKEAVEQGLSLINQWPENSRVMKTFYQALVLSHDAETAQQRFLDRAKEQPWNQTLWRFVASNSDKPDLVWQQLQENPAYAASALRKRMDIATGNKDYELASQLLEQIPDSEGSLSESLELQLSKIWLVAQKSREIRLSNDELNRYLLEWDQYSQNFASLSNYYYYKRDLLYSMGRIEEAAHVMKQYSELNKDSTKIYHQLVARYSDPLTSQDVYGYGYRMIQRNPYSASYISSFVNRALYWGQGSAVIALQVIEEAKQRGVFLNKKWEEKALSDLGDNLAGFLGYRHDTAISNSLRYIGWFETARESALEDEGNQVRYRFEGDQPEVEIILPSGEVLVRRDDATKGKMVFLGRGATFIKAEYNKNGSLTKIEDSSGEAVSLHYDVHENIIKMVSSVASLQLQYNQRGKPIEIELLGAGKLTVTYDNNNEILNVNSVGEGNDLALNITQSFQKLTSLAASLGEAANNFELPDISVQDEMQEQLYNQYQETPSDSKQERKAALDYASYLFEHSDLNQDNVDEITNLMEGIFKASINHGNTNVDTGEAIVLWHKLKNKIRPYGVPKSDYQLSQQMRLWMLANRDSESELSGLNETLNNIKVTELKTQNWMEENALSNSGYWYRETLPKLLNIPSDASDISSMVSLENGDVLLGTSQGLLLRRHNYWSWFVYEGIAQKFIRTGEQPDASPRTHINDLKVSADGVIWVATNGGLFAVEKEDAVRRWNGVNDGMPDASVAHIQTSINTVWIAIKNQIFNIQRADHMAVFEAEYSSQIDAFQRLPDRNWLIHSADALVLLQNDNNQPEVENGEKMLANGVEHFLWQENRGQLWWWNGTALSQARYQRGQFEDASIIADKSLLPMSKKIHGLQWLEIPTLGRKPVVLTDQGLAIWHQDSFNMLSLPYEELRGGLDIGPLAVVSSQQDWTLVTEEAVYQFTPSRSQRFNDVGKVRDLLYIPEMGRTFAANGRDIMTFYEGDDGQLEYDYFASLNARILRRDSAGNMITHSGSTVIRVNSLTEEHEELFTASSDDESGRIADIYVDKDDSIWVAAGADLFHWQDDTLTRFNYYVDPVAFPARSNMLARVFRDVLGTLYVVASDEGHLNYKGVSLAGGLLELTDSGFTRVSLKEKPTWFATAYTPISESMAIISTTGSFALDREGEWSSYKSADDVSYKEMSEQIKMLYLGGAGAKMPSDKAWLFPSAAGVVIYYQGQWLYPDRLNQLLPDDQKLGQYGARVTHAISIDDKGRVFVGTDRGVLLYKAGNLASLLSDHNRGEQAFVSQNNDIQSELNHLFLDNIPEGSEQGELIANYQRLQARLEQLESQLEEDTLKAEPTTTETKTANIEFVPVDKKKLKKSIKKQERKRQRLLADLEREHPALFQMLRLDPREIGSMYERLDENQVLLQFIPSPDKLLTQVVTQEGVRIIEIDVSDQELNRHVENAIIGLRQGAFTLDTTSVVTNIEVLVKQRGFIKSASKTSTDVNQSLAWLYDKLLRPVEVDMKGKDQVYVTPVGKLNYLPFGSLIKTQEPALEYAIEKYNIGVLPSLYHFNLVMNDEASLSDTALFIADPDGSLPGAKQEVESIASLYKDNAVVLQGDEASLEELEEISMDSRVIHFATHGILDSESAADSYLIMANDEQLGVIDISVMDLSETDIVVLSACESGIGTKGLEYASLARAFAHAKVPSIVASYWQVNDEATSELMQIFYKEIQNPEINLFAAMANAQRAMISRGGALANPSAWASFSVFGKP